MSDRGTDCHDRETRTGFQQSYTFTVRNTSNMDLQWRQTEQERRYHCVSCVQHYCQMKPSKLLRHMERHARAHQWAADYFLVRMVVHGTKPVENPCTKQSDCNGPGNGPTWKQSWSWPLISRRSCWATLEELLRSTSFCCLTQTQKTHTGGQTNTIKRENWSSINGCTIGFGCCCCICGVVHN